MALLLLHQVVMGSMSSLSRPMPRRSSGYINRQPTVRLLLSWGSFRGLLQHLMQYLPLPSFVAPEAGWGLPDWLWLL